MYSWFFFNWLLQIMYLGLTQLNWSSCSNINWTYSLLMIFFPLLVYETKRKECIFFFKDQRELCYCLWYKILILNQIKRKNIQILVQFWDSEVFPETAKLNFKLLYIDHLKWHIHLLTSTHNCNIWQKRWKKRWDGMMVWYEIIKILLPHRDVT